MIEESYHRKHYGSACRRFLVPLLAQVLQRELTRFGPDLARMLAERIVELLDEYVPPTNRREPGQLLWCALDRHTRGGSRHERVRPVVLTLLSAEDTERLAAGVSHVEVRKQATARMFEEAAAQGALLSTRDLAMILSTGNGQASRIRCEAEAERGAPLPHPGVLHDVGSTITHKVDIVRKAVYEGMDPMYVARATRHSQKAVDRYLRDFQRIRAVYQLQPDIDFIHQVTGYSKRLIHEYIDIIQATEINEPTDHTEIN